MIPIHKLINEKIKDIRVIKLGSLSQYNIMEPHRHDYVELFFFNRGGGTHEIDFKPFKIDSNSIHIVSAGRVHKVQRDLNSQGYVVLFHPTIFEFDNTIAEFLFELDCYDVSEYSPIFKFEGATQTEIATNVTALWEHFESDSPLRDQFIINKLSLICLYCLENTKPEQQDISKDQQVYVQFRRLLRQQFKTLKKVKEYATKLGVSSRKLNEIVSSKTGLSVSKLIHKQIILEAKRLLNAGISSKEVTFKLNFEDPSHFSKFFKTQTGTSPSEFQKIHD